MGACTMKTMFASVGHILIQGLEVTGSMFYLKSLHWGLLRRALML